MVGGSLASRRNEDRGAGAENDQEDEEEMPSGGRVRRVREALPPSPLLHFGQLQTPQQLHARPLARPPPRLSVSPLHAHHALDFPEAQGEDDLGEERPREGENGGRRRNVADFLQFLSLPPVDSETTAVPSSSSSSCLGRGRREDVPASTQ